MRLSEAGDEAVYFGAVGAVMDSHVVVKFGFEGEPMTKARARVVVQPGRKPRAFTPAPTKAAEAEIAWACRQALTHPLDATSTFGVIAIFFYSDNQRRDVDNMLKLVMDAMTGIVWKDDSQVMEVTGRKVRAFPVDEPHTEVLVYRLGSIQYATATCEHCGKEFRTYDSWAERRFCTADCHYAWRRAERDTTCQHCGKRFESHSPNKPQTYCSRDCAYAAKNVEVTCAKCGTAFMKARSLVRAGNSYCSDECKRTYWREQRTAGAKGVCQDCGGPTSKASYKRCRACNYAAGGAHAK